jgi:hypothetical protein
MASRHLGRYSARLDGDFVVFLTGMRLNRPWKVHQWWPVYTGMSRMLRDLHRHPRKGLLGAHAGLHLPAWRWFNRAVKASGDVGIWHETYLVRAGGYETIYGNMPRIGLAAAGDHVAIARRGQSAARRVGVSASDEVAVPSYPNP